METLTTTIRRPYLVEILHGTKPIEYRDIKPYWTDRLAKYHAPFLLRLINGMSKNAPEVTVTVTKVMKSRKYPDQYELHLGEVIHTKNCRGLLPKRQRSNQKLVDQIGRAYRDAPDDAEQRQQRAMRRKQRELVAGEW